VKDDSVGDSVTVVWAEELFAPVQYQSFRVGPFSITTKIRPGEDATAAMSRAWNYLDAFARKAYVQKRDDYLNRLAEVGESTRSTRGR